MSTTPDPGRAPWAAGLVACRLTVPPFLCGVGLASWWAARQADHGSSATSGVSASLASLTVASLLAVAVAVHTAPRARRTAA